MNWKTLLLPLMVVVMSGPLLSGCVAYVRPPPPRGVVVVERRAVWVPGHWVRRPHADIWVAGRWR